ncbi:hypothetical protein ABK905_05980 [Acerihabitans sp. KWT182]|uniref:Uncharacterized protein n=1 Tax=Acerihabitans sp. KWT182 TaxID=3157919 RepID=A0AAU7QC79_9GAMM
MIIKHLKRLFLVLPEAPVVDRAFRSETDYAGTPCSETDALISAMGCDHMPVYMPAEVWQRVSDMEYGQQQL